MRSGVTSSTGWPSWVGRNPALWCPERDVGKAPPLAPQLNHATAPPFVEEAIERGSTVHTDGWLGYEPLQKRGYWHEVTFLDEGPESASKLLPRVHRVASLLKRWLLGTHQGAVNPEHLDYYLDEFTFRFNRRNSRSRGKLFYRLVQQAVAIDPVPYKSIIGGTENAASVDHKM